jgi:hypothetical protein
MIPVNISDSTIIHQYAAGGEFDIISYLISQNNNLIKQEYPQSISLLFAIIQYLRQNGTMINGKDLQKTLASVEKESISDYSSSYKGLGAISEIINSNGITSIRTIDRNPIVINNIQAEHESRLKINYMQGNARIDVLNGISIGHVSAWNKLNYILLDRTTGEITYDYDNRYKKKMPVYSELLQ